MSKKPQQPPSRKSQKERLDKGYVPSPPPTPPDKISEYGYVPSPPPTLPDNAGDVGYVPPPPPAKTEKE